MEKEEYYKIYRLQDKHAWYLALIEKVIHYIDKYRPQGQVSILDAGCGAGGLLSRIRKTDFACGIDISDTAVELCRRRGINNVIQASVAHLPFKDNFFDIVTSLDVLYHAKVIDDRSAIREGYRVLKKGGIAIINLPAYQFLESVHDRFEHGCRRYTAGMLKKKVEEAGFSVVKMTYSNTFLFAPIAFWRLAVLKKKSRHFDSDLKALPGIINQIALIVLRFENLLQKKILLPFGLSLFCIARKN